MNQLFIQDVETKENQNMVWNLYSLKIGLHSSVTLVHLQVCKVVYIDTLAQNLKCGYPVYPYTR